MVDHYGCEDTRTFREVACTGKILKDISEIKGAATKSEVAVVYDWESRWALDDAAGFKFHGKSEYQETCINQYKYFMYKGINTDVISPYDDFSRYKLIVMPMLYLIKDETIKKIEQYVANGGCIVSDYITGYVDEADMCYLGGFPAIELKNVFGAWNEKIDVLYPDETVAIKTGANDIFAVNFCELLHSKGSETIAEYDSDFYKGMAAAVKNNYKNGTAYYIGFRDKDSLFTHRLFEKITNELSIKSCVDFILPKNVTANSRMKDGKEYIFVQNFSKTGVDITIKNIADYRIMLGNVKNDTLILNAYQTAIICRAKNT